jgi:glycosyltransferase involved in cell wall biosynthesis
LLEKNVLQFVGSFDQGGSEFQAVQLIRLLHLEGSHRVFVACLSGAGVLRQEIDKLDVADVIEFPLRSFYDANMLRQVLRCVRYIQNHKISILQTHDFYTNVFGMAAGSLSGVPVRIAAKRETGMRSKAQFFVEKRAFNLSHNIVVNADAVKEYLVASGVSSRKITTIYNGLDLTRLDAPNNDRRATLDLFQLPHSDSIRYVTILANLRSPVKNHRMFLRAAQQVAASVPDVHFVIAGEGQLATEIQALAHKMGLGGRVTFTGRCTSVAELLWISDVCVLSSESEGFSNAILEYMAASKPVVATAVGGAKEAVVQGETGYLVASNDDPHLAARLIELLEDPKKASEMGKRGQEIAEEKFSLEAQLENTLSLYRRLSAR